LTAWVSVNGVISKAEEARVSPLDRGFLFGDAVYETGRSYDGVCLFLEEHFSRLRRSASKLAIPVPWSDEDLQEGLYKLARAAGERNLYFRFIVTRGPMDHVSLESFAVGKPTLVIVVQSLPDLEKLRREGIKVLTSKVIRNSPQAQDPNIKTSNYLNSLLALQDVRARGGEDAVLCDALGRVTEGTTFSIFGISANGRLITPSLQIGILDSITRRHILKAAADLMPVEEGFYPLKDFQECTEVFLVSSVREVVAISEWDGKKYPVPGPVTKQIYDRLKKDISSYLASHPRY
jgi:branched-chain amino acid aminotransferase